MIIVTTPMCEKIVEWAGLSEFKVNKNPDEEYGDLAILLSESKVNMNSLAIKLNTFSQIKESIKLVSMACFENGLISSVISEDDLLELFNHYNHLEFINFNINYFDKSCGFDKTSIDVSDKKVKVYSEFLKDIVEDIGASIINFSLDDLEDSTIDLTIEDYNYVVFPDYLKKLVSKNEDLNNDSIKFIEIPTHSNVSKNPIERANERYSIIVDALI